MPIQLRCPNSKCRKLLTCPDEYAGKSVRCSACNAEIELPLASDTKTTQVMKLGEYQILRKLGEGGMGIVYEALQIKLDRIVALKVLPDKFTNNPVLLIRFCKEAKLAAALNHPNIVQVYDIDDEYGVHFFAMEYVNGDDLQQRLKKEEKLNLRQGLLITNEVARALQYAKEHSIIHRDVKPANIMVTREGQVKLADLGLSKSIEDDSHLTSTGLGFGSPLFTAPEQATDASKADHRADIYSLGITLLYLLTGKPPFEGPSPYSVFLAHTKQPLPSGADLGTELPPSVETLIKKMCAKDPNHRYQDYTTLITDIQKIMQESGIPIGTGEFSIYTESKIHETPSPVSLVSSVPASNRVRSQTSTAETLPWTRRSSGRVQSDSNDLQGLFATPVSEGNLPLNATAPQKGIGIRMTLYISIGIICCTLLAGGGVYMLMRRKPVSPNSSTTKLEFPIQNPAIEIQNLSETPMPGTLYNDELDTFQGSEPHRDIPMTEALHIPPKEGPPPQEESFYSSEKPSVENFDKEFAKRLEMAEECIREKRYEQAIRLWQEFPDQLLTSEGQRQIEHELEKLYEIQQKKR